ncbi:MAG: 3-isopropylmalate dehydratase small subunit [Lentisphaeraceae bacterium]|nr:3-isopropylmalate dehydratase small subunit [Lentisphaeraceae bacterium]
MSQDLVINKVSGTAISVRGNDIDTDRIIPARFLKCVVFEGLGEHAFEDDRKQLAQKGEVHPFDMEQFQGAEILFVNKNFGCGSSREHAPQSLARWGIKAIVGESFSEIFFGNNISMGIPCVHATEENIEKLISANEADPASKFTLDLESLTVSNGSVSVPVTLADGPREQFLKGSWDVTAELLSNGDLIEATASNLPYFGHWK